MTSDKIRALVVEDEPNSQYALIKLIERYCPNVKVVGAVFTVEELLEELQVKEVDVLFLDINLGKKSAFEALLRVRTRNFQIIVTTAHRHHALKAFEHRAVHFLLKPVATEELIESVARLRTHHQGINGDSLKKLSGL
ncbi:MAG: response regulator, partial [Flavobacteriia bacterium]|nr:response regulator [Flavobacteriia bacterium]